MTGRRSGDWLFDLGNSRLKLAPLSADGQVGPVEARPHAAPDWRAGLPSGDTAWLCTVAPAGLSLELVEALAARFRRISIARTAHAFGGVRIGYAQPRSLGVDRFLALLGARGMGEQAWLVVGVGTALTIDLLGADGVHAGGRIAPSPTLMREALHQRAPHLPEQGGEFVAFAGETRDALASGCEGAAVALVQDSLARAGAGPAREPTLLLHGGGAPALASRLQGARMEPALVLHGLAAWARAATRRA